MSEGTHLHLGLLRAWDLWFQGKDIKGDGDFVWGVSLLWWSRLALFAGFLGGLMIVVEIVGEDRLVRYGVWAWKRSNEWATDMDVNRIELKSAIRAFRITLVIWVPMLVAFLVARDRILHDPNSLWANVIEIAALLVGFFDSVLIAYFAYQLYLQILGNGYGMLAARLLALALLMFSAHFTLLTS